MIVLDLFAGAGGAALGLHQEGFEHVACVERDASAAATLRAAGFPAVEADVRDVDYAALAGTIDVLWASPPCQAWSGLGKREGAADGERNGWPWTLDAIETVRPTWALMENVATMAGHPYLVGIVLPRLRSQFRHVDARVLNAADYGLPQGRRRLVVVAGPARFPWPAPTHGPEAGRPHVAVRDALPLADDIVAMAHECNAGWGLARVPISLDQPAPTITAGSARSHGGNGLLFVRRGAELGRPLPPRSTLHRRATPEECAILQGFPTGYSFSGRTIERRAQVGNAVPPVLAAALARAVRIAEEQTATIREGFPALGDRVDRVLRRAVALVRGRLPLGVAPEDVDDFVERHAVHLRLLVSETLSRRAA